MAIPVIFTNSTAGMIEAYLLDDLINQGRIVAYKISGDWVRIGGKAETAEEVLSESPIKGDLRARKILNQGTFRNINTVRKIAAKYS